MIYDGQAQQTGTRMHNALDNWWWKCFTFLMFSWIDKKRRKEWYDIVKHSVEFQVPLAALDNLSL